ncbi:MAG: hypothetical protein RR636_10440 [Clostridium sp.]|uniref:hypothetical protein n=1 Tax=Clostridium sp. TaxID=1506 RepID=UPI0030528BBB
MECEFYKNLSDRLEYLLKNYCENEKFDNSTLKEIAELTNLGKMYKVKNPCMNCANCFDFIFYYNSYMGLINKKLDLLQIKHNLQLWEKFKHYDKCIDFLSEYGSGIKFNKNQIFKNNDNKITVYVDHNILIEYAIDKEFREKINLSKEKFQYCFSSSHINEIIKIKDIKRKTLLLDAITSLTDNIGVYDLDSKLSIVRVDISYIKEIEKIQDIAIELGESYRQIQMNDNKVFFKEYRKSHFSKMINNKGIYSLDEAEINKLLLHVSCQYRIEDIKEKKFENTSDINHIVYSLFNMFNILGYKIDKTKDTINSSAHDIEHIKYASICDIFVTDDSRLHCRAAEIYKFIKSSTKTIDKQELLKIISKK